MPLSNIDVFAETVRKAPTLELAGFLQRAMAGEIPCVAVLKEIQRYFEGYSLGRLSWMDS